MSPSSFYRVALSGEQVAVGDAELAALRKDILLYFDTNLDEPVSIFLPADQVHPAVLEVSLAGLFAGVGRIGALPAPG